MNQINFPKEKNNFIELLMVGWAYVSVFGCLIGCIILIVREILKLF